MSEENKQETKEKFTIRFITWVLRLLTGGVFVYSGFVKAIDPWGTLYKFNDYLAAMGLEIWPNLVLTGVFLLCAAEFLTGVFLVLGCFRRTSPFACLAFMCVMLPLTLWVAVSDPVADCGCFGDALVISNWATFWKNVVLTVCALWLCRFNSRIGWLITPAVQWIAFVASAIFIIGIGEIGYNYQPLLDFRPYAEGTPLFDLSESADEGENFIFIYEKDGVKKEFTENDELPDENDGWTFVDRKEITSTDNEAKLESVKEKNLRLWDENGEEDLTEVVAENDSERQLFILMPDLEKVSIASSYKINSLNTWAERNNIEMVAIVAGSKAQIDNWRDLSMAEYPIYTADDTAIKEVARGNPAVVYVSEDTIRWKSSLKSIQADDFLAPETSSDPMSFKKDDKASLRNFSMIYLTVMTVFVVISFLPKLKNVYGRRASRSKQALDKAESNSK